MTSYSFGKVSFGFGSDYFWFWVKGEGSLLTMGFLTWGCGHGHIWSYIWLYVAIYTSFQARVSAVASHKYWRTSKHTKLGIYKKTAVLVI